MSLAGSSFSRNSNWAMMRLATSSNTGPPRNTMRSFSRREKMSYARSPLAVCSTTIGTRAISAGLLGQPRDRRFRLQEIEQLVLQQPLLEAGERTLVAQAAPHLARLDAGLRRHP